MHHGTPKPTPRITTLATAILLAGLMSVLGAAPAAAHGPINPVASDYLATVQTAPAAVQAQVIDGDLRLWMHVRTGHRVIVLDYQGAPYLRFTPQGISVNRNSEMFFLDQTPAQLPPDGLGRTTPPHWTPLGGGSSYEWHDGRLHALASVALTPGQHVVGTWRVPVILDGTPEALSGPVSHRSAPSIVWFWWIAVILLCVLAGRRLHDIALNQRIAHVLASGLLCATVLAAAGRGLHGRPGVAVIGLLELVLVMLLAGWVLVRMLRTQDGSAPYAALAFVALWEGFTLLPTLTHGYVLLATPALASRIATVICLGAAPSLALLIFATQPDGGAARMRERADP